MLGVKLQHEAIIKNNHISPFEWGIGVNKLAGHLGNSPVWI